MRPRSKPSTEGVAEECRLRRREHCRSCCAMCSSCCAKDQWAGENDEGIARATLRLHAAAGEMTQNMPSTLMEITLGEFPAVVVPAAAPQRPAPQLRNKLEGCIGVSISALLPEHVNKLVLPSGTLSAADGLVTGAIGLADLKQGIIIHSRPDGSPLPKEMGGPLRAWFPPGCAVQESKCGMGPVPVNLKGVVELRVRSTDSAASICFDEKGRALILQRGPTAPWMPLKWNLPGGGCDEGETAEEAAVREAVEETGLTPQAPQLVGEFEYVPGRLLAVFVSDKCTGKLEINWESCAHEWVSEAQLSSFEFVPVVEVALREAFARAALAVDARSVRCEKC